MPDWLSKNLGSFITIVVISVGGVASFTRTETKLAILEERVTKLEASNTDLLTMMAKIDKKISLLICRTDPNLCLER